MLSKVLARVSEIQESRRRAVARLDEQGYPYEWVSPERYEELNKASMRPACHLLRGDDPGAAILAVTRHDGDVRAYVIRTEDLLGKSLLQMVEDAYKEQGDDDGDACRVD